MSRLSIKSNNQTQRAKRSRTNTVGSSERPRLSVFVSGLHVSAQVIDDSKQSTIVASTSVGNSKLSGSLTEKATWVGHDVAKKAKAKKVTKVVFDRGAKLYHGRIKALADAAREEGLEF